MVFKFRKMHRWIHNVIRDDISRAARQKYEKGIKNSRQKKEEATKTKKMQREMGISNEEWTPSNRYGSIKKRVCRRGKNTKGKGSGNAKTNAIRNT